MNNPITAKLGPLPVWAWGLGVSGALYAYYWYKGRTGAVVTDTTAVDSTALPDNSGTASSGSGGGNINSPNLPTGGTQSPQTVEAWAAIVSDWLIGNGSPVAVVQSAFSKLVQIANGDRPSNSLTAQEVAVISQGIAHFGSPPGGPVAYSQSPDSTGPVTGSPAAKYVVQLHKFPVPTNSRSAVKRFSDASVATDAAVERALQDTVNDPSNASYRQYYGSHGGFWPAMASIHLHVVKAA